LDQPPLPQPGLDREPLGRAQALGRNIHFDIAERDALTGQALTGSQFDGRQGGLLLECGRLDRAARNPHAAIETGALPATGGEQFNASVLGGFKDGRAAFDLGAAANGFEVNGQFGHGKTFSNREARKVR
jgi:hypothetical protein